MSGDIHCAACHGTDYIGRPCRGRTNFHEEYDAARALADARTEEVEGLTRDLIDLNQKHAEARALADELTKALGLMVERDPTFGAHDDDVLIRAALDKGEASQPRDPWQDAVDSPEMPGPGYDAQTRRR